MRAVKGSLGLSFKEMYREMEELRWTRAVGNPPGPPRLTRLARSTCLASKKVWWLAPLFPPNLHFVGRQRVRQKRFLSGLKVLVQHRYRCGQTQRRQARPSGEGCQPRQFPVQTFSWVVHLQQS
jgi:hypothetical protein